MLISTLLLIVVIPLLWLIIRLIFPRATFYEYIYDENGRRSRWEIGYVKRDGSIFDATLPRLQRRVGQVLSQREKGIVRIYRRDAGPDNFIEAGWVDAGGKIYEPTGAGEEDAGREIGSVSPLGKRRWHDLWTRCHSEVPPDGAFPVGKCIEAVRLGRPQPNAPTLLARAGAALLLYRRHAEARDEAPREAPRSKWDVVLPAAIIFTILFFVPGFIELFAEVFLLFPPLGQEISFVLTMFLIFAVIWVGLYLVKDFMLSDSDRITTFLLLLNRQTGIEMWNNAGIVLALAGLVWSYKVDAHLFFPLFAVNLIGFLAVHFYAPGAAWPVEPRARHQRRPADKEVEEGE